MNEELLDLTLLGMPSTLVSAVMDAVRSVIDVDYSLKPAVITDRELAEKLGVPIGVVRTWNARANGRSDSGHVGHDDTSDRERYYKASHYELFRDLPVPRGRLSEILAWAEAHLPVYQRRMCDRCQAR